MRKLTTSIEWTTHVLDQPTKALQEEAMKCVPRHMRDHVERVLNYINGRERKRRERGAGRAGVGQ